MQDFNLKIGFVNYINSYPLSWGITKNSYLKACPTKLHTLLVDKTLEIALTSSLVAQDQRLQPFSHFCIAAREQVLSVNLYTQGKINELNGQIIGITSESATSFMLLKIICSKFWKITPIFQVMKESELLKQKSFLLIGDRALQMQLLPGYLTTDLATAWYQMTALPFVFALFFKQRGLSTQEFETQLQESYNLSKKEQNALYEVASKDSGLGKDLIKSYYNSLHYELGNAEKQGLNLFLHYANELQQTRTQESTEVICQSGAELR